MKKMFLMLAIMALATGAFAAWSGGVSQAQATSGTDDLVATLGDPATIYAQFTIAGAELTVNGGTGGWDTWTVGGFMPSDYGWSTEKFDLQNTGGVTLDVGLHQSAEAADVTIEAAAAWDGAWGAATDTYRMWAVIVANGSAAPAAGTDMTATNYLAAALDWYEVGGYMDPTAGDYAHVGDVGTSLTLWASDAGTGDNDDQVDLWLGFACTPYGWTTLAAQTVTMSVSCKLSGS